METKVETPNTVRPSGVQLRARRSPRLIVLGVLAIVMGALGSVALHSALNESKSVVSVAKPIARGQIITAPDLTVVDVPDSIAVPTSPHSDMDAMIGKTALTDLPQGSFPTSSHVGDNPLPDGKVLVGLRMQYGQLPVSAMPAGTRVRVVSLLGQEDTSPIDTSAVVAVAPRLLEDGSTFTLDLQVADEEAAAIARLAAAGQLAVVMVDL